MNKLKSSLNLNNTVGDNDLKEVAQVGVRGVSARTNSLKLSELIPYVERARKNEKEDYDSFYKQNIIDSINKLIEINTDLFVSDFDHKR